MEARQHSVVQYKNFKPRTGMEPRASELMQSSLALFKSPVTSKVVITDIGGSYYFSVVVCAGERIFSNETFVEKNRVVGRDRLWQLEMLVYLTSDIVRRLSLMKSCLAS